MKIFRRFVYSILSLTLAVVLTLSASVAFGQRALGAKSIVLDDGSGNTIGIQTPASGWTGNIPFVIPIPPPGNPPSGFVYTGTSANQLLTWVLPNTTGPAPNNYAGGVQGSWQPTTLTMLGGVSGTGTNGTIPIWTGTSTQGNSLLTDNGTTLSYSGTHINSATDYQIGGSTVLTNPGFSVFVGIGAGTNNAGNLNTFLGYQAGYSNTTGSSNVFSGFVAGHSNTTGNNNTFTGIDAGYNNLSGSANTFSGSQSGLSNTTGFNNTFTGVLSGYSNTTGQNNVFSGINAGYANTTGFQNAFAGSYSGYSNTTGLYNTFYGNNSGYTNSTGSENTFTGGGAGFYNTTGDQNTFTGDLAGAINTTGFNNTFTGLAAGITNITGDHNTTLGNDADVGSAALTNATAIGAGAIVTQSNTIQLGNSSVQSVVVPVGTTAQRPATPVQGMIRFNTTTLKFEGYDGAAWQNLN